MHNSHYDDIFFTETYVAGLKEDIKAVVEPHVPQTRAVTIAKIQQRTLERSKTKQQKHMPFYKSQLAKPDLQQHNPQFNMQRIRQLMDYRKANNLCYSCGDKYEPGHQVVCPKRQQHQVNAIVIIDLDQDKEELTEEMLNQLADEDLLAANFGQLSLNALSTVAAPNAIQLRTLVNNKVMLILLTLGVHTVLSAANLLIW